MDTNNTPAGGQKPPKEELRDELQAMGQAAVDLMEHLVRVPAALAQIPLQYLPEDTADHARTAASEGFKAVQSLLNSLAREVDRVVADQTRRTSTRTGTPPETGDTTTMPPAETPPASSPGETHHLDGDNG